VTADHQKVVHPQEDLNLDLLADQKADLQEAVILTAHVMTQELLASSEGLVMIQVPHVHHFQNHPIVFHQIASHTIQKVESASLIKEEIVNHSIAITARVANAVHSETASHLMERENLIKEVSESLIRVAKENHSIVITARVANAVHSETANHLMERENPIKVESVSHLAEQKIQHVHRIKEIIAGIAMLLLR
jgi:hypothetical protein